MPFFWVQHREDPWDCFAAGLVFLMRRAEPWLEVDEGRRCGACVHHKDIENFADSGWVGQNIFLLKMKNILRWAATQRSLRGPETVWPVAPDCSILRYNICSASKRKHWVSQEEKQQRCMEVIPPPLPAPLSHFFRSYGHISSITSYAHGSDHPSVKDSEGICKFLFCFVLRPVKGSGTTSVKSFSGTRWKVQKQVEELCYTEKLSPNLTDLLNYWILIFFFSVPVHKIQL